LADSRICLTQTLVREVSEVTLKTNDLHQLEEPVSQHALEILPPEYKSKMVQQSQQAWLEFPKFPPV